MHTHYAKLESLDSATVVPSEPQAAVNVPLTGIERLTADAPNALDRTPPGAMSTPGEIEYASWIRMLRRTTP